MEYFFQTEDGMRDVAVTGVQTCALPISLNRTPESHSIHPIGDCHSMRIRNHLVASHASGSGPGEPGGDPLLRANPLTALEQRHGFVCSQNMCLVSVRHFADTSHRQSRIEF